jgi:alanyl-tRNA synthetase
MNVADDAIVVPEGLTQEFVGLDTTEATGAVILLWADGKQVERLTEGQEGEVFSDRTPFYAESGGQVGDVGRLSTSAGSATVLDTQRVGSLHGHRVRVDDGELRTGDSLSLAVDDAARLRTVRNHSGTHLLHFALREVLGGHVRQRGSLVAPGRLRFDFSHFQQVTADELTRIETLANGLVMRNTDTEVRPMSYDDAVSAGAMAFFGDKYGDEVRTVRIGVDSFELCGGTHVRRSGDIGFIKITAESSIQAGVRRIEAATGEGALELMQRQHDALNTAADLLHATPTDMVDRIDKLLRQNKEYERELQTLKRKLATGGADDLVAEAVEVEGVKVLAARVDHVDGKGLRDLGDRLRDKLGTGALLLATGAGGKVALLCMVSKDLTDRVRAGDIVRSAAEQVGGRGGGRPDMAQAGGPNPDGIASALATLEPAVRSALA